MVGLPHFDTKPCATLVAPAIPWAEDGFLVDYEFDPYEAVVLPRMLPIGDDYTLRIETRVPEGVLRDLD